MYEASVGNGSNFLLNISPDNRGRLPEADKNRLLEVGEKIRQYETPTGGFGNAYKDGEKEYSIKAAEYDMPWGTRGKNPQVINRIVIEEDLTNGQNVKAFDVYFYPSVYKDRKLLVYRGATIGRKTICHIPAIYASKITVEITESDGEAKIKSIKTYKVN